MNTIDIKIEDYLHLYLGCRCEVETYMANLDWGMNRTEKLTAQILAGVHGKRNRVLKVFLRPLSDMSEEEKANVVDPMTYGLQHGLDKNICEQAALLTEYLLSKHFDLFNLHEAGLCLYKTDLK